MTDLYYDTEKPLILDMAALCRKLLAKSDEESTAVEQVLNEFFTKTEQGWHHSRCESVIQDYYTNISAKSAAGKASAAKRESERLEKLNRRSTDVEQPLNSVVSSVQLTTSQEPLPTSQEPLLKPSTPKKIKAEYTEEFEIAFSAYPARPGASKKDAFKAWNARLNSGADPEDMILGVRKYSAYVKAKNTEPEYIKQPATFFGPDEHYKSDWTPQPRASPAKPEKFDPLAYVNSNFGRGGIKHERTIEFNADGEPV